MDGVHFPANIPILRCDISPVQCILGASSGIKRPGCEVDHSSRYEYEYIYIYKSDNCPVLVSHHIMKANG